MSGCAAMLSITDAQLKQLTAAADLLPPDQRSDFLRSVAGRLADVPITDHEVMKAIGFVLSLYGVATNRWR